LEFEGAEGGKNFAPMAIGKRLGTNSSVERGTVKTNYSAKKPGGGRG